jgi:glycosyltransferase involved in cell wall biosynthesis
MDECPKISVIGTAFNQCGEVERTVWSYLNQTFQLPYEILVMDDGSTDGTDDMIRAFQEEYPGMIRYFYFNRPEPSTFCAPENVGIKQARADIIVTTHGLDRIPLDNALEELYFPHLEEPDIFVTLRIGFIGKGRSRVNTPREVTAALFEKMGWPNNGPALAQLMPPPPPKAIGSDRAALFESPTFSIRRDWILKLGGYDERYTNQKNYSCIDMWAKLVRGGLKPRSAQGACFHQPHPPTGPAGPLQRKGRKGAATRLSEWGNLKYEFERAL